MSVPATPAHEQGLDLNLTLYYPEHAPRKDDPNYKYFNAAKRRMKAKGLLVCAIKGCTQPAPIELHHSRVEFALQNGIDVEKFNELYGLHLDDTSFKVYIEEEGNLEPLCSLHHRGALGVHSMPEPQWRAFRVWRDGVEPPAKRKGPGDASGD